MGTIKIFIENFGVLDCVILVVFLVNLFIYLSLRKQTNRLYKFYNSTDKISNLSEEARQQLKKNTKKEEKLTVTELLDMREKMNQTYSMFANVTTMFPLLGMFGTVWALIPMVDSIGTTDTSSFFAALTSTALGIVFALIFKFLDATISYKIDDNEKHTEHLMFPKEQ
ncbi:MAG: MotA/TolQ/ExbB proton channel family protein [Lachnospiraceae bacterium]|jgi:biopolymer transport protein ExbB/TolQ|nr:MotA/TolQ/ExbB proton channel family protein [Lachnospiraceae bacterium]